MEEETLVLSENEFFELFAFLVTSASMLATEPKDYGPMRLVAAATRLGAFAIPHVDQALQELLHGFLADVPHWQQERRRDPEGYYSFLEDCSRRLAEELMRRDPPGRASNG